MITLCSPTQVQKLSLRWKCDREAVALVPTMGCLHAGHLQLVKRAKKYGRKVIVSLFVNPLQFGPHEDFEKYPRTFTEDSRKLEALGVDLLFHPTPEEFYPSGFATTAKVKGLSEPLEGLSRPGHFEGVATVCLKLFHITMADFAVFGEKDYQQLRVIEQMTRDLHLPLVIVSHEIVREEDGLALSSRNRYLSPLERSWALQLSRSLQEAQKLAKEDPGITVGAIQEHVRTRLATVPLEIDYVEVAGAEDLQPAANNISLRSIQYPRLFLAVRAGTTRLIDNGALHFMGNFVGHPTQLTKGIT